MDFILYIFMLIGRLIQTMLHEMEKIVLKPKEILLNRMAFSLCLLQGGSGTLVSDGKCIDLFLDLRYLQECQVA